MSSKTMVILRSPAELTAVEQAGIAVLARYPNAVLVEATEAQRDELARTGLELATLPEQPVRTTGNSFELADALAAEARAPAPQPPHRTGYFLVQLIGPPAADWLAWFTANGVEVFDSLDALTLLVGTMPENAQRIRAQAWVAEVTPYRAAMRVAPAARGSARRQLDADFLAEPGVDDPASRLRVEVTLFPGEAVAPVTGAVVRLGGTVIDEVETGRVVAVVAVLPSEAVMELAGMPGVRSIEPYALPQLHNDRAREVMRVPGDNVFDDPIGSPTLAGGGQIVAIADSGLDTGNADDVHRDVRGRVAGITSWATKKGYAKYTTDPAEHDDGPADPNSGHGTHVSGSVLGNGAAARAAGAKTVPAGVAPEARLFFQAIGQKVAWKSREQLAAEGIQPFQTQWPPEADGLYGIPDDLTKLFGQAFEAGARIHTNSWGAPQEGAYTTRSQLVDQFIWEHPDMLILYSAGNAGVDNNIDGVVDEDAISSPATAKNCLTVGASENLRPSGSHPTPGRDRLWNTLKDADGNLRWPALGAAGHVSDNPNGMAAFSSRGPVDDLRVKPDVVAPGTNILSMLSSAVPESVNPLWGRLAEGDPLRPFYCWSGGTSMATPLVAGAAAVARQYLVDVRRHEPSAALLKAVLINGADPIAGQFPGEVAGDVNTAAGFGRINLARSVATRTSFADSPADAVSTGEVRVFEIKGVRPGEPLRITLVWTDAPAGSGGGLVNQLYLRVEDPDGTLLDGDVSRFPDPVNNVQRVIIANPRAGRYRIAVLGFSVIVHATGVPSGPAPRQSFAVSVTNSTALTRTQ